MCDLSVMKEKTKRSGWVVFPGGKSIFTHFVFVAGFLIGSIMISAAVAKAVDLTEISLEELMNVRILKVVSASKYEQKSINAPSAITVVTAEQIQKFGYRTLADILRGVRGFYIRYDRNYDFVGFRGFNRLGDYSTRVLLLVDGVRINDNIYDSAPIGTDFILDVDLIERIEIVRGPSYALYGSNAFFSTINVITRDAVALSGVEATGSAESYGTHRGRLSYGKQFEDNSQALFSGTLYGSSGQSLYFPEFDTEDQNRGVAKNCDGDEAKSLFAKFSKGIVSLSSAYVKRGKEIPTAPWGVAFNDSRTEVWDERAFLALKLERTIDSNRTIMARMTYGLYRYDGDYLFFDQDSGGTYINRDEQKGEWGGVEAHVVQSIGTHKMIFGGEYHDNFTLDQKNYDVGGVSYLDDRRNTQNWGLFVQDEFPLFKGFNVNAGVRYDRFSTFGGTINPRIALIYRPYEGTSIKYLTGRSFRAPDPYEMFYNDGELQQRANTDLHEESLISHELVWEQMIGEYFSGTASVYHYTVKELISLATDADGLLVYLNQDDVEMIGFEFEANVYSRNGWTAGVNYTFQDSEYLDSGKVWVNSPRHLAKCNVSIPLIPESMFLSIEEQYTSRLETLSGKSSGNYFLTNLTLYWREAVKGADLSGSIYNLFDNKVGLPGGIEHSQDVISQDGISFRAKLTFRF
jgi:outer membrane receptor for ferrienterochelin and colicins